MDDDRLERLRRVAATMKMSKAEIIEAAIDVRLDMLEGYVKLDTAPVKTIPLALARKTKGATLEPGGITYVDGVSDAAVIVGRLKAKAQPKPTTKRVRGWDADGKEIYG